MNSDNIIINIPRYQVGRYFPCGFMQIRCKTSSLDDRLVLRFALPTCQFGTQLVQTTNVSEVNLKVFNQLLPTYVTFFWEIIRVLNKQSGGPYFKSNCILSRLITKTKSFHAIVCLFVERFLCAFLVRLFSLLYETPVSRCWKKIGLIRFQGFRQPLPQHAHCCITQLKNSSSHSK